MQDNISIYFVYTSYVLMISLAAFARQAQYSSMQGNIL
jgi:hypothetical protein